jgi:uncharacterized membrane protein YgcG
MSIKLSDVRYQNPREVIESGLPDLRLGVAYVETVSNSSLRDVLLAPMDYWDTFLEDVTKFYDTKVLDDAFARCRNTPVACDPDSLSDVWEHFATFEHVQIAEERDLQGRFLNNVINHVLATNSTLLDARGGTSRHIADLSQVLPKNVIVGSAKIIPIDKRLSNEPDIVFKVEQEIRLVGELKYCVTCNIPRAWEDKNKLTSQERYSARHVLGEYAILCATVLLNANMNDLGQVCRDMAASGARFGFVSTYAYTIFLKIVFPSHGSGSPSVFYSDPIPHDAAVSKDAQGRLTQCSVRLGILYLLHRAAGPRDSWHFDPKIINPTAWTTTKINQGVGEQSASYTTPNTARYPPRSADDPVPSPYHLGDLRDALPPIMGVNADSNQSTRNNGQDTGRGRGGGSSGLGRLQPPVFRRGGGRGGGSGGSGSGMTTRSMSGASK